MTGTTPWTWPSSRPFWTATQPKAAEALDLAQDGPKRTQFLHRLQGEIAKRGVIDVLRNGVKHGPVSLDLFYGTPTPGNVKAEKRFAANLFSVTRQLRYSKDETQLALDLGLFINGLPVATFELKNRLTKQTVDDAVQQYKRDREPEGTAVSVRPVHGALRGGRPGSADVHAPEGQGFVVSALQPGAGMTGPAIRPTRRPQDRLLCGNRF